MYTGNNAISNGDSDNISISGIESLLQFEHGLQNYLKSGNTSESDLSKYFDKYSVLLCSLDSFRMEFIAFANLRYIIEYIIDEDCLDKYEDFIRKNINSFVDLLESKIKLIENNDTICQVEYEKQLESYDSTFMQYNSYFYQHIYENTSEDNQDAIEIGKILLGY